MNKSRKLVNGLGVKGMTYPTKVDGKTLKEYQVWQSMLERCTEKTFRKKPTYIGTTCSENFKSYTFFYEWCQEQVGFGSVDENGRYWHLDKDLLVKGNKVYSEDTCVFVPQEINSLTTVRVIEDRSKVTLGVYWHKKGRKYGARCSGIGKHGYIGLFNTVEEAFLAYKACKEMVIKDVADRYKPMLDDRAYQSLIKYEVIPYEK